MVVAILGGLALLYLAVALVVARFCGINNRWEEALGVIDEYEREERLFPVDPANPHARRSHA